MPQRMDAKAFAELASQLEVIYPTLGFEVFEDNEAPDGFYIAVLSSGPDFGPDLQATLTAEWRFSGWGCPDQRNNMGTIKKRLKQ